MMDGGIPCAATNPYNFVWSRSFYLTQMEQAQRALNLQSQTPTNALLSALGEAIGNNAAHEIAHQLNNVPSALRNGLVVLGLDDGSVDTYNGAVCTDPSVFTGVSADGKTPFHWGSDSDQSLQHILGKRN